MIVTKLYLLTYVKSQIHQVLLKIITYLTLHRYLSVFKHK